MKLIKISAAISLDGYIDDRSANRLKLSSAEDLQDLYADRSLFDAILVGANTIRLDNPSLSCHSNALSAQRHVRGQSREPIKVTVTNSGNIDPAAKFFTWSGEEKIILCPKKSKAAENKKLAEKAKIIEIDNISAQSIVNALDSLNIESLFVEGGTSVLTMFLSEGIFHRLRLAVAPFFVGDNAAPPFVNAAIFRNDNKNKLKIVSVRNLGNTAVLEMVNEKYTN